MNVVIVGNPQKNGDQVKAIATILTESGINVRYPAENALGTTEDISILETFERIDWADWVIAIPVEGITFEYATTSEIAYAKHVRKPVFIYYG